MHAFEILTALREIYRAVNLDNKVYERKYNISALQVLALKYIRNQTDYRCYGRDLSKHLFLSHGTVSNLINRMQSKGYLYREKNPSDRRNVYIVLTAKGADILKDLPLPLESKVERKLLSLSDEQRNEIGSSVKILVELFRD